MPSMPSSSSRPPKDDGISGKDDLMMKDVTDDDNQNDNDVSFLQAKCSLLKNQLAFLRSQQKQRKDQRKKEKGEIVSTFKSMKEYIDHLEEENRNLTASHVSANDDKEVTELKQKLALLQTENETLKDRETQVQSLQNKCQELTLQCSSLKEEVSERKDTEAQLRVKVEKYEQIVDHVPQTEKSHLGHHVSTSVLADASTADASSRVAVDESIGYGGDDGIKDDLFGKVVDHTPATSLNHNASKGSGKGTSSVVSLSKQEDDTVLCVAEKAELESIQDGDDEDDEQDGLREEWEGSVAADNFSLRLDVVVDHVPALQSTTKMRSRKIPDSSIMALADASVASSRVDDTVVGDEGGLFGKIVDHTPGNSTVPLKKTPSTVPFSNAGEDDTVLGVTERMEMESVARQDEDLGDVSSHDTEYGEEEGASTTREVVSVAATTISVRFDVSEETHLVDHVPQVRRPRQKQTDTSVMMLADASTSSSPIEDTIADGEGGNAFGPIVDHTPSIVPMSVRSVATSVATQNSVFTDINEDEQDLDDTIGPCSTIGDADSEGDMSLKGIPEENHLVDHVPKRRANRNAIDGSVRVFLDSNDNISQVDTIAEDEEMEFGPIVDHTPFSTTRSVVSTRSIGQSVAASTMAVGCDMRPDDDMDTIQDITVAADTIAEEDDDADGAEESHLVDHVPTRRKSKSLQVDTSTHVLVDMNDCLSEVGKIAEDGRMDYGSMVDHTPFSTRSIAPSVAASTAAVGDSKYDDGSTLQDNTVVTDFSLTLGEERLVPLAGESDENHLVDHVPTEASHPTVEGSVQVLVDTNETISQVDTIAEEEAMDYGPIVDHTPALSSTRSVAYSVAASMMTIGSDDSDSTSIQDNTTVGLGAGGSITGGDDLDGLEENLASGYGQAVTDEKNLVDHVPQISYPKPADMSILVQTDQLDAVSEVDDENNAGIIRPDKFGPIVDHTPAAAHSAAAQSVAASMLTTTSDVAADIRADDDMDATWFSALTEKETGEESSLTNLGGTEMDEVERRSPVWKEADENQAGDEDKTESRPGDSETLKESVESTSQVMVETVNSDSDDENDEAYVRVDAPKQESDEKKARSTGSDDEEPETYNLKEMKEFAEGLAAKTANSKENPFEAGVVKSVIPDAEKNVEEEVQDYIAQLASVTATRDSQLSKAESDQLPDNRTIEEMQKYVADLASGAESVTGSNADDMQKYIADLATFTGIQTRSAARDQATAASSTDAFLEKLETPTSKGNDDNIDDARNVILDEIGGAKRSSVFGKLFGGTGKKTKDKKEGKKSGTWA
jgi:hypothetical protein